MSMLTTTHHAQKNPPGKQTTLRSLTRNPTGVGYSVRVTAGTMAHATGTTTPWASTVSIPWAIISYK